MFPTRTKSGRKVNLTSKMAEYQETRARTKKTLDETILDEIERTALLIEEYEKDIKGLTMNKLEVQMSHTSMTAPVAQSHALPIASVVQSNAPLTAPAAWAYATQYSAAPMTLSPPATRAQVVTPSCEQPRSRPQYELNPAVEEFMPIGYHPRHTSTPAQQYMPHP